MYQGPGQLDIRELIWIIGENYLNNWAKVVDCGDAPLTFLVSFPCSLARKAVSPWLTYDYRTTPSPSNN